MDEISKSTSPNFLAGGVHAGPTLLDSCSVTEDSPFLREDYFSRLVSLERKRTERSGNPSLLMLIDLGNLSLNGNRNETIGKISLLLSSMLRETDVVGWYRSYSVIGVILCEIGDSDLTEAMEMISAKLEKGLSGEFERAFVDSIHIQFEYIKKEKRWGKPNSLVKLRTYDFEAAPGHRHNFAHLFKSFLGKGLYLVLVDLLIISAAQLAGFWLLGRVPIEALSWNADSCCLAVAAYLFSLYVFDLYDVERVFRRREISCRITLAAILPYVVMWVGFRLEPEWGYASGLLVVQTGAALVLLTGWRLLYRRIFQLSKNKVPTLIIGAGEKGIAALNLLMSPHSQFEVAGFLDDDPAKLNASRNGAPPVLGATRDMFDVISGQGIKAVVLAMEGHESARITRSILEARLCGREVYDLPSLYEKLAEKIPVGLLEDRWFVSADGFHLISREYVQKIKRIFDFLFSGSMLLCCLPLLAATAMAIKLDSPGPIFFKQTRVGRGGKLFTLFKFRSMCTDAEKRGAKWADEKDPRVTRVGGIIRIFHIDELAQVWNIFIGDMSLIGPRPERPEFVKDLEEQVPYYGVRHSIRPGLTGWAQIKYPYGASVEDSLRKLEYDLYYIKNMSILQDIKIFLRTIGVVVMGEGAR